MRQPPFSSLTSLVAVGLLLPLIFVAYGACKRRGPDDPVAAAQHRAAKYNAKAADLKYFRDERSGLCFAYLWEEWGSMEFAVGGPALTWVPCEAVERLIVNGSEVPLTPANAR